MDTTKWVKTALSKKSTYLLDYTTTLYRDKNTLIGLGASRLHALMDLPAVVEPYYDDSSIDKDKPFPAYRKLIDDGIEYRYHGYIKLDKIVIAKISALCKLVDKVRFELKNGELTILGTNDLVDGREWDSAGWVHVRFIAGCDSVSFDSGATPWFNPSFIADALCADNPKHSIYWGISTAKGTNLLKLDESNSKRVAVIMPLRATTDSFN
jgi:hypothetical protein